MLFCNVAVISEFWNVFKNINFAKHLQMANTEIWRVLDSLENWQKTCKKCLCQSLFLDKVPDSGLVPALLFSSKFLINFLNTDFAKHLRLAVSLIWSELLNECEVNMKQIWSKLEVDLKQIWVECEVNLRQILNKFEMNWNQQTNWSKFVKNVLSEVN